jgi:tetratricopeptide (TPR) repeat protein
VQAYKKCDHATALQHYTAAIKLDPANTAARNNRAMAYLALDMFKEAAADTSEVLQAEPNNVKALLRRAAANEGLGAAQQAAVDCKRALELEPNNGTAQLQLGRLQAKLGSSIELQQDKQQKEFPPPPAEPQQS